MILSLVCPICTSNRYLHIHVSVCSVFDTLLMHVGNSPIFVQEVCWRLTITRRYHIMYIVSNWTMWKCCLLLALQLWLMLLKNASNQTNERTTACLSWAWTLRHCLINYCWLVCYISIWVFTLFKNPRTVAIWCSSVARTLWQWAEGLNRMDYFGCPVQLI